MNVPTRYGFGGFVLDLASHRLRRGTDDVDLPPKAFDLLRRLVEERHRVVTREELLDSVWSETAVTENTLTQRIKEIRHALGDDPQQARFLRTVPRVGYQFIATVEAMADPAARQLGVQPPLAPVPVGPARTLRMVPPARSHALAEDLETARAPEAAPEQTAPTPDSGPRHGRAWRVVALIASVAAVWLGWKTVPDVWLTASPLPSHTLLSVFDGSHRSASLSPDGRLMAFLMDVDGVSQVFVKPVDGGEPLQATTGSIPALYPRWSPRGDQIVFAREGAGIWTMAPLGGDARRIIEEGHSPSFGAGGATLVFERGSRLPQSRRWGLWLADADGQNIRGVPGLPEKPFWDLPTCPALSPDGQWIAFFRQSAGPRGDLWIVRATGHDARQLTFDEVDGGSPIWSPDGRTIIFSSGRSGARTLWRVPIDGGEPIALTTGAGSDDEPTLSADGGRLVYTHYRDEFSVQALGADGATSTIFTRPVPIWHVRVSPADGALALFMAAGADVQVFEATPDGREVRQVTHTAGPNIHPAWSWDGEWIYYYRQTETPSLRRIRRDGTGDALVVDGWTWSTHPDAQPDPAGRRMAYTRVHRDTGRYEDDANYVRDLETGAETKLAPPHMHQLRWAPDGSSLIGQRHDGTLASCPADGGACRPIVTGGRAAWQIPGDRIFFQRQVDAAFSEVWRVEASGAGETRIGRIGPFDPLAPNHDVTADGRVLWIESRPGRRELWLMAWQ
jgi:Tol biopolymer transport system component/DNA-binding winged helix-turn-helix (wHTH) protein